jgi:hypothetical protein
VASYYDDKLTDINDPIDPHGGADKGIKLGLDFKLVSVIKMIILAIPLIIQVQITKMTRFGEIRELYKFC